MQSVLVLAVCILCTSVSAKISNFVPFDGPNVVQQGEGGTKIFRFGIDFWIKGTPPHPYKILGTIEDKSIVDSPIKDTIVDGVIAKYVVKLGGNAVIVASRKEAIIGFVSDEYMGHPPGSDTGQVSMSTSTPVKKIETNLLVVQYLDLAPTTPAKSRTEAKGDGPSVKK
jgi:hypothetical protein